MLHVCLPLPFFRPHQPKPPFFFLTIQVDNHIHLAAAMSAKHLLTFMKDKANEEPDVCAWLCLFAHGHDMGYSSSSRPL
jgi:hypothetical protein